MANFTIIVSARVWDGSVVSNFEFGRGDSFDVISTSFVLGEFVRMWRTSCFRLKIRYFLVNSLTEIFCLFLV